MTNKIKPHKVKKFSFNIVDAIITLVILLSLVYIVYVHALGYSISNIGAKQVEIEYTIKIEKVDSDYYSKIKIGDKVRTGDGANVIGTVISISPLGRDNSISVSIRSEAFERNRSYKVNEQKISTEEPFFVRFLNYAPSTKVKCTSIRVI